MPETINFKADSHEVWFVLAAKVMADKAGVVVPWESGVPVVVQLTINGVEVPYAETLREIYRRFNEDVQKRIQERAARIALEAAELHGLDELQELIYECRHKLQGKIEDVFGVELRDD